MAFLVHFWSSRRDWIHSSLRSSAESAIRQRIEDFNGSNLSERIKSTAKMPWKWFFGDFFGSLKLQIFESSTFHVFRRPVEMILEMPVFIGDFLGKKIQFRWPVNLRNRSLKVRQKWVDSTAESTSFLVQNWTPEISNFFKGRPLWSSQIFLQILRDRQFKKKK